MIPILAGQDGVRDCHERLYATAAIAIKAQSIGVLYASAF